MNEYLLWRIQVGGVEEELVALKIEVSIFKNIAGAVDFHRRPSGVEIPAVGGEEIVCNGKVTLVDEYHKWLQFFPSSGG